MSKVLNLQEKFQEYLHQLEAGAVHLRYERFADAVSTGDLEQMKTWLEAAFREGAKVMAEDTVATLGDYATAVAGLPGDYTLVQVYDLAAANLTPYYAQIFEQPEDE